MCDLARPTPIYTDLLAWHSDVWCPKAPDRTQDTGHRTKTRPQPTQRQQGAN